MKSWNSKLSMYPEEFQYFLRILLASFAEFSIFPNQFRGFLKSIKSRNSEILIFPSTFQYFWRIPSASFAEFWIFRKEFHVFLKSIKVRNSEIYIFPTEFQYLWRIPSASLAEFLIFRKEFRGFLKSVKSRNSEITYISYEISILLEDSIGIIRIMLNISTGISKFFWIDELMEFRNINISNGIPTFFGSGTSWCFLEASCGFSGRFPRSLLQIQTGVVARSLKLTLCVVEAQCAHLRLV